ncbi:MAG: prepilin-type N-terminal cleavage/methylation domain-containing protein [Chloroflexi bacterium]|nr:prepilin-type N-terminal cleavage/methylation domain-containing protein [Chloroflexota bacterium]
MKRLWRLGDDGFTLVELLMASVIGAVVVGVISAALIVGFKTIDGTQGRFSDSHDGQIAQDYFTTDAQSSDAVDSSASDTTCGGASPLLRFRWTGRATDPPTDYEVVSYRLRSLNGESQLIRQTCAGTTDFTGLSPNQTLVLGHNILGTPTVACTYSPGPPDTTCNTGTSANPFVTVKLTVVSQTTAHNVADTFTYVLKASRRSSQ